MFHEAQLKSAADTAKFDNFAQLVFFMLLAAACAWILHLPLFPSQDGPVHLYYARVTRALLTGQSGFASDFHVAHVLPPYAVHAYSLMLLSQFFSPERSEQLLACACVLSVGLGFWYFARQIGPSAHIVAISALPFFLHRFLFFGFYGYSFGIGAALAAMAVWWNKSLGWKWRAGFLTLSVVALFSHPVPFLIMIGFCWSELLAGHIARRSPEHLSNRHGVCVSSRADLLTLLTTSLLFGYIELYSHSGKLWSNPGRDEFLANLYRTVDALRTTLMIPVTTLAYQVLTCVVFLAGLAGSLFTFWKIRQSRRLLRSHLAFAWGVLLLLVLPYIPATMNGSSLFAERLAIWVALFVMGSAAVVRLPSSRFILAAGVVIFACELGILEAKIGPVARSLQVNAFPARTLTDVHVRTLNEHHQPPDFNFDPYWVSSVRIVDRGNGLLVDGPWLGLEIMMLEQTRPPFDFDRSAKSAGVSSKPSLDLALVWNDCVATRLPSTLQGNGRTHWQISQFGCFRVAEQRAGG
jgi:MFS family permease